MKFKKKLANAIRALSMDAVQRANSGHPGAPMGMADIAEVLWNDFLSHNPNDPSWINRDRFVLSNGHGSMLLYSLLHLSGYDLSLDEIKNFRQLHSKTPGHPEFGYAPGVETTTGPLGQGLANAVGMAIAEKVLADQFNKKDHQVIDHFTYVFIGDGCLMEGISHEVCSLAGTLGLGKLIVFYDDNGISIDGEVDAWFSDDTKKRFESYGWHVVDTIDGHNSEEISQAIIDAQKQVNKPTLVCCKTIIGFGSPNKQGKEDCHGAALGEEEVELTRKALDWEYDPFVIPKEIYDKWDAKVSGKKKNDEWDLLFSSYSDHYPELAAELKRRMEGRLPEHFDQLSNDYIIQCQEKAEKIASRKASQNCLNAFGPLLPELLGGSADLAGSNLTIWNGSKPIDSNDASGNYIFYGVREFGMSAIMNGISLHGGFINYGATFLMFMEYARNAVRMAALMKKRRIFIYTHDSSGLGEDGPTHQPVEQMTALRVTPNLNSWRPCDTVESAVAWKHAIQRDNGPTALVFSRQSLEPVNRTNEQVSAIVKGGFILYDCPKPELLFIATGSEVGLAMQAAEHLGSEGVRVRVVSMPCAEIFSQQSQEYLNTVLPPEITNRIAVEALHKDYWYKFVGLSGRIIGMDRFGESAPGNQLMCEFGFTKENLVSTAKEMLS